MGSCGEGGWRSALGAIAAGQDEAWLFGLQHMGLVFVFMCQRHTAHTHPIIGRTGNSVGFTPNRTEPNCRTGLRLLEQTWLAISPKLN